MKLALRAILAFFTFCATYFFVYWVPLSLITGAIEKPVITNIIAAVIGLIAGYFVWKRTGNLADNLSRYVFIGSILTGTVLFLTGFLGPIIFSPSNGQGPLLGFILGPIGFGLGLLAGAIFWYLRKGKTLSGLKD